jgi:hypothetical protein
MKIKSYTGMESIQKRIRLDASLILLILSNILTIILAVWQHWNLITMLWIYWAQSVIIGIFNFIKILDLKNFSTENFSVNGHPVEPTRGTKVSTAIFFAVHYGFFHAVYFIFLMVQSLTGSISKGVVVSTGAIIIGAVIFFMNHLFSFFANRKADSEKKQNIGKVMFFPYARIIPMHLTIIFGLYTQIGFVFFLILKTIADVTMHMAEHRD